LNALPIFAPGWLEEELRAALAEVTAEIEEPEIVNAEEIEAAVAALREIEKEADELFEQIAEPMEKLRERRDAALEGLEIEVADLDIPEIELDADDWLLAPDRFYFGQLRMYRRFAVGGRKFKPLILRARTCACGCGEPIRAGACT